jgi:ABC-type Fe3+/spermidine/putrescine transport system ATPase subunit
MIKIDSVTKAFSQKKIIDKLSLEVQPNEILSLLGPNGCGKTTLLNLISGLARQDSGNIYIDGELVSGEANGKKIHLNPSERKIGYVFQSVSLFPHMRVQDNVAYGLKAMHLPKEEVKKRTEQLLDFVGMLEHAKFYPSQLSGGQKQRVALARSLATEPQVLLLDEPVSAVDPQLRESFRLELKNYLRKLDMTVIYVTHNLSEAFVMSDRIAVMGNGCVEQIGSGQEIFDKPASRYVAGFLGINSFKGKAVNIEEGFLVVEAYDKRILARAASDLAGRKVVLTLKPEDIVLLKATDSLPIGKGENSVTGAISEMIQMRSTAQVTIDAGFTLKARISLNRIKQIGLSVGDKVQVCFNADSINVFADEDN